MSSALIVCCFSFAAFASPFIPVEARAKARYGENEIENALYELLDDIAWNTNEMNEEGDAAGRSNALAALEWRDCGNRGSVGHFKSFTLSPVPLRIPGNITYSFTADVAQDIETPIKMNLIVKKKFGLIWVNVCGHVPGGCNRGDICPLEQVMTPVHNKDKAEDNIDQPVCKIPKGLYNYPQRTVFIRNSAPSGLYSITANFMNQGKSLACLEVQVEKG